MMKMAASVLLKLFSNGNEKCHSIEASCIEAELLFSNVKNMLVSLKRIIHLARRW